MKYKGILLDIDNSLYDYNITHEMAINSVYNYIKNEINENEFKNAFNIARKKTHIELLGTASSHNRLLYFQKTCEILKLNPLKYALHLYELYWNTFLNSITLFDGVVEFLENISKKYIICFITDLTADIQYKKIHKLQLDKYISYIVTSEEAGVEKPHPYIFLLALNKLNLSAKEVLMIGDNFQKDILGAFNLQIDSIWINHENQKSDYDKLKIKEVKNIKELLEIL